MVAGTETMGAPPRAMVLFALREVKQLEDLEARLKATDAIAELQSSPEEGLGLTAGAEEKKVAVAIEDQLTDWMTERK